MQCSICYAAILKAAFGCNSSFKNSSGVLNTEHRIERRAPITAPEYVVVERWRERYTHTSHVTGIQTEIRIGSLSSTSKCRHGDMMCRVTLELKVTFTSLNWTTSYLVSWNPMWSSAELLRVVHFIFPEPHSCSCPILLYHVYYDPNFFFAELHYLRRFCNKFQHSLLNCCEYSALRYSTAALSSAEKVPQQLSSVEKVRDINLENMS